MPDDSIGPLITVAAFCERILDEKDSVPSLIRLVDRIILHLPPSPLKTDTGEPVEPSIEISFYIRLTTFRVGGTYELLLVMKNPSGKETEVVRHPITLEQNKSGLNFKAALTLGIKEAGLYWMRIFLDNQFFTQIPLEVLLTEPSETQLKKQE